VRPRYETEADLDNERRVAEEIGGHWACILRKNPDQYRLDFTCYRDERAVAFAEIKCRDITFDQYDTIILSLSKVMAANLMHMTTSLPAFLIVEFTDALAYADLLRLRPVTVGGRVDRGDSQDMEPVIHIPIEDFRKIR
jgi:hypothetical protein